jgi:putative glycerol-1-phosphate prenyltransferase
MNYQATYLEAGSGAYSPVPTNIIALAKKMMPQQIILVGGGIRTESDADKAWQNGADIVVIGNHLETHPEMVKTFCNKRDQINASRN